MTPKVKRRIEQIRQGIMPEGYKRTKVGIAPTEWKERTLGSIYAERKEPGNNELPILTVSIHSGVSDGELDEDEIGKKVRRIEDRTQYRKALSGDLVFNMMRAWQGAIGVVRSDGMVSPAYIVATPNESVYPLFMDYYMKTPQMVNTIHRASYGLTDFRLRLYWDSFAPIRCAIPSVAEQQKIAAILSAQDRVIELTQQKVEEIKKVKKFFLSKMFPKKGQIVPEIRFAGFTDAWEQRKLGNVGSTYTGLTGKSKDDFGHGNGRFVTYMNVFTNPVANGAIVEPIEIDKSQNAVKSGDVFFTTSSETPEEVGMSSVWLENSENTYLNSFCFGFRPTETFDPYYLAYMLRSKNVRKEITFLAQGISRYNISKSKMMDIEIPVPEKEEQELLGSFFRHLDHLITLHQRKIEEEKKKKKALMQLLLTGIVRMKND